MVSLVITLVIIGVALWALNEYVPMDPKIKKLINIVVAICVICWLLYQFGVLPMGRDIPVPQLR